MIAAVILAAGESRRMGAQKLLLPFGASTVIGHVVDQFLGSAVDPIIVVMGHDAEQVAGALAGRKVCLVENPGYAAGMLSSVRCGLRAVPPECRAVLVGLGDQPSITTGTINGLIRSFTENDKGIVVPVHGGKRGHPLLFSERYRAEILARYDDVGLRGLLHTHADDVLELAAAAPSVLSDMDYPEDYQREVAAFEKGDPPDFT